MPIIRIDPAPKQQRKEQRGQAVGAIIGKAYGGPGLVAFAAKMGGDFVSVLKNFGKEPVYPFEVDTETNQVKLLVPPQQFPDAPKYKQLAKIQEPLNLSVQTALQSAWNTGTVANVPKRYLTQVQELLSQRALYYREPVTAPPEPTITEGAQYSGAYSMAGIVPPGGFAGFSGMTAASKAAMGILGKRSGGTRKRRKSKKKAGGKRKKRASGKRKKLVKGSAAAKRFMANLRRKRK